MRKIFLILPVLFLSLLSYAQYDKKDVGAYIEKFKDLAIAEQMKTNIPAAIKLGQGILETSAGTSELAMGANNHFGIKCKSSWTGDTYYYTDDAKDECFRKYTSAEASFKDHSKFLQSNNRYQVLFDIYPSNYKDWAYQLKNCGYATHPKYAERLIKVIEDYDLQQYTMIALNQSEQQIQKEEVIVQETKTEPISSTSEGSSKYTMNAPVNAPQSTTSYYQETQLHGLKGFYARKGEILLGEAIKYNIRYATLLSINDLKDEPLPYDMFIYLQNKKKAGDRPFVIVREHETLHMISQREGVQLASLRELNRLDLGEEPAAGVRLQLQYQANLKPELRRPEDIVLKTAPITQESTAMSKEVSSSPKQMLEDDLEDEEKDEEDGFSEEDDEEDDDVDELQEVIVQTETENYIEPKQQKTEIVKEDPVQRDFRTIENKEGQLSDEKTERLKQRFDRTVYSDKDALPRKDQPKKEQAPVNRDTVQVSTVPANEQLNRPTKQNLANRVSRVGADPNKLLNEHMALVKKGQFPKYVPKSTGVAHTQEPPPPKPKVKKKPAPQKKNVKKKTAVKKAPVKKAPVKKAPAKKKPAPKKKK